jgi:PAS domain S-box-containing protein
VPSAIDRIADVFLAADVDSGAIVDANPAACALLGLSRPELLASNLARLVAPADVPYAELLLEAAAEARDPQRAQLSLLAGDGSPIRVDVRTTRLTTRGRILALLLGRS